ncbi:MAG TPA: DUF2914 domain-containing protein [Gemmatimonadaceae bacterium]|nr:DUF2914 domain-containing protein [Gemmatimonadaceae bacterium]
MRNYSAAVLVVSAALVLPARVSAQEQAGAPKAAASAEVSVGTGVENRALVGAAEVFKADAGKLFCFSKIENAADTDIEHVWYKGDAEVARVKLHVGGSPWRTHSSKTLGDSPAGNWRCDIVQDGKVVKSAAFKVE